jgi:TP901 family phage tail tape measure protein
MAGDFQTSMTQLVTGAGMSQDAVGMVSKGILQMARDTGTSTKQLTDGMYMISSAGFPAAKALDILKAAAEGAKVGNADLGVTADAVTTIMKDYPNVTNGAAGAMNTLVATVANGKTHMQDLATALSGVLPAAQAAHIGLNDVMAAMAAQTAAGVPAADAATHLRQMIIALSAPSHEAKVALAEVGISTDQLTAKMQTDLPGAVQMITTAIGDKFPKGSSAYMESLKTISGGLREMQGILALSGDHMADFQGDVGKITDQVNKGGNAVQGWAITQKTFNVQFDRAKEVVTTLMIELGQKLLPVATQLFKFIADEAIPKLTGFISWISGSSASATLFKGVLIAVGGAITAILVTSFVAWAVAAGTAAIATIAATWPVLAIGAAIALLIVGIKLLIDHWQQIWTWFSKTDFGKGVIEQFTAIKVLVELLIGKIGDFLGVLGRIKDAAGGALKGAGQTLHNIGIPGFAVGTDSAPGGLAIVGERGPELVNLPRGAQVIPSASGTSGGSGGSQTIVVQLVADGRRLAEVTVPHLHTVIRNATGARSF